MSQFRILKGIVILIPAILLLSGCSLCLEPKSSVTTGWSYEPDDSTQLARFVPLPTGGALASSPMGDVYNIDSSGRENHLLKGTAPPPKPQVVFNASGDTFGILRADGFTVYDMQGEKLAKLPVQPGMYKLVPSGQRIYSPEVREHGPETRKVIKARILDRLGTVQAEWPVPGLEISRLTSQYLVYATSSELVKTTLSGNELWRTPVQVRKLQISSDGRRSIVNSAYNSNTIHHYVESARTYTDTFDGPVWNLAIATSGRYSAATSQTVLHIYVEGAVRHVEKIPVEFIVSVDVNDRGEVLVGGQAEDKAAYVVLYDLRGTLLWKDRSGPDNNAWRPEVRFDSTGDHFVVRYRDRLASYTITRSP